MDKLTRYLKQSVTLLALLFLTGCLNSGSQKHLSSSQLEPNDFSFFQEESSQKAEQDYTLQINDVVEVKFAYEPHLNELVTIRPDGKISLQLVDEVKAAGLTCAQLDNVLTEKYSRVLSKPEIAVIVREITGQKVYVGGEVSRPGIVDLKGKITVLEAIFSAGGFTNTAEPENVIVISRSTDNTRSVRIVDLGEYLAGIPGGQELVLKPYDVIYVPKTAIANANKFGSVYKANDSDKFERRFFLRNLPERASYRMKS